MTTIVLHLNRKIIVNIFAQKCSQVASDAVSGLIPTLAPIDRNYTRPELNLTAIITRTPILILTLMLPHHLFPHSLHYGRTRSHPITTLIPIT